MLMPGFFACRKFVARSATPAWRGPARTTYLNASVAGVRLACLMRQLESPAIRDSPATAFGTNSAAEPEMSAKTIAA